MDPAAATLRLATPDDGAACAAIYRPYVETTAVSFEQASPDAAEMAARIARTIERTPWLVAELGGAIRAYAYASRHRERAAYDWTAETTVYVDEALTGRGLGRAAMTALLAILRIQGFHLAVAGVTLPNPGSVALHGSLGFTRIGEFEAIGYKQGRWHGVEWYGLELGPREPGPTPIRPLPEIQATDGIRAVLRAMDQRGGGRSERTVCGGRRSAGLIGLPRPGRERLREPAPALGDQRPPGAPCRDEVPLDHPFAEAPRTMRTRPVSMPEADRPTGRAASRRRLRGRGAGGSRPPERAIPAGPRSRRARQAAPAPDAGSRRPARGRSPMDGPGRRAPASRPCRRRRRRCRAAGDPAARRTAGRRGRFRRRSGLDGPATAAPATRPRRPASSRPGCCAPTATGRRPGPGTCRRTVRRTPGPERAP